MSLTYAILSVLSIRDSTGYDLSRRFGISVNNFWPATHQQIYAELSALSKKRLVVSSKEVQDGKPDKKVYSLSEKGKQALIRWVQEPADDAKIRASLLIKVFAGNLAKKERLLDELARHRQVHQQRLEAYLQIENTIFNNGKDLQEARLFYYLTLRNGIISEEAWLQWCDECIKRIRNSR